MVRTPLEEYTRIDVEYDGPVATVVVKCRDDPGGGLEEGSFTDPRTNVHWALGEAFSQLRGETDVRVVVLTGYDGKFFRPPPELYHSDTGREHRNDPYRQFHVFTGIVRMHQEMAEMEKPIVARVNGDAIGFGQSLALAADLIVAEEDARFIDHHMAMGEIEGVGAEYGFVTGDGGSALVPLFLPPTLAKEYLMLARPFTAAELASHGVVNHAVSPDELDATVDDIVQRLLKRSAFALAWTKRTANRRVVDHLNTVADAAAAYEMVNFLQMEWLDWEDPKTLRDPEWDD